MTSARLFTAAGAFLVFLGVGVTAPAVTSAQEQTFQQEIVDSILADGYWDETGTLDAEVMETVVAQHGETFAFAFTDRSYEIQQDPTRSAAAILALSILEELNVAGGPNSLLFVTGDDASGATTEFAVPNIERVLAEFDRSDPEAAFADAAAEIRTLGATVTSIAQEEAGLLGGWTLFIILGVVAGVLALTSMRSATKKRNRVTNTLAAKTSTQGEIQAMSDLILDLDPRVTIANDPDLKARYVNASDTYREVLEKAKDADTGHEIADLRIDIAKARWKLDVIDAELEGRTPPDEPFTRDTSGSAWDSTRGTGASGD